MIFEADLSLVIGLHDRTVDTDQLRSTTKLNHNKYFAQQQSIAEIFQKYFKQNITVRQILITYQNITLRHGK